MALVNQAQFMPTIRPVEGEFVFSVEGEDVWIAYEGTLNRHGELSALKHSGRRCHGGALGAGLAD